MAPNLHHFSIVVQTKALFKCYFGTNLHYIWCKFSTNISKTYAGNAPSKGAIWDKFIEQPKHQAP